MAIKGSICEKEWVTISGLTAACWLVHDGSHRCGYVGVPKGHPAYGLDYDNEQFNNIQVHGGLTYGEFNQEKKYPLPETEEKLYVLGFDCAHWMDKTKYSRYGEMRSQEYVEAECESLAVQLAGMEK